MKSQHRFTGERLMPSVLNDLAVEHLARYAFALPHVAGKQVLDLACGEGYGTALMAKAAASVVGVDVDAATIQQAERAYRQPNINFVAADAAKLPFDDQRFDVVVSFETLEHVPHPEGMMAEIIRVMKADGLLIISTPEQQAYSSARAYRNPFHTKEFTTAEFAALLQASFMHLKLFGQQTVSGSAIHPLNGGMGGDVQGYSGNFQTMEPRPFLSDPLYLIALASNAPLPYTVPLFFHGSSMLEAVSQAYEATWAYRIGRAITAPVRLLRSVLHH